MLLQRITSDRQHGASATRLYGDILGITKDATSPWLS